MRQKLPFPHRHRDSVWIICGGHIIWCYRCGAFRQNEVKDKWIYPTGKDGANPWKETQ